MPNRLTVDTLETIDNGFSVFPVYPLFSLFFIFVFCFVLFLLSPSSRAFISFYKQSPSIAGCMFVPYVVVGQ